MTASLASWSQILLTVQRRSKTQNPEDSATTTHFEEFYEFKELVFRSSLQPKGGRGGGGRTHSI